MNFLCYKIILNIKIPQPSPEASKIFKCLHKAGRAIELNRAELKGTLVMTQVYSQIVPDR